MKRIFEQTPFQTENKKQKLLVNHSDLLSNYFDISLKYHLFQILAIYNRSSTYSSLSRVSKHYNNVSKETQIQYSIYGMKEILTDLKTYFLFHRMEKNNVTLSLLYSKCSIHQGYANCLKILLDYFHKKLNQETLDFLLVEASTYDQEEAVKILLAYGGNINDGRCLNQACLHGHTKVVRLLLENNAPVNSKLNLFNAISNDHIDVVELLLKHGANITDRIDCLIEAVQKNRREIVKIFKLNGAKITPTILHWADNNPEMLSILKDDSHKYKQQKISEFYKAN